MIISSAANSNASPKHFTFVRYLQFRSPAADFPVVWCALYLVAVEWNAETCSWRIAMTNEQRSVAASLCLRLVMSPRPVTTLPSLLLAPPFEPQHPPNTRFSNTLTFCYRFMGSFHDDVTGIFFHWRNPADISVWDTDRHVSLTQTLTAVGSVLMSIDTSCGVRKLVLSPVWLSMGHRMNV